MNGFREYEVDDQAVAQAERLGMGGDVRARLATMARRSANCTHANGNRRFDEFLLWITGNRVIGVAHFQ